MMTSVDSLITQAKILLTHNKDIVYPFGKWENVVEGVINERLRSFYVIGAWVHVYREIKDEKFEVYRTMVIVTHIADNYPNIHFGIVNEMFVREAISAIRFMKPNPNVVEARTGRPIFELVDTVDFEILQQKYL